MEEEIGGEEMMSIDRKVVKEVYGSLGEDVFDWVDFLIEVMIGYGMGYEEDERVRGIEEEIK